MAHIHTEKGQLDQTASAWILWERDGEFRLFMHMHRKLGVLLEPGGHIELDETPWQAMVRELLEETGYEPDQLKVLQPAARIKSLREAIIHPFPVVSSTHNFDPAGNHRHTDLAYAFITDQEPRNLPLDGEARDIRWLSLAEINGLAPDQTFDNVRDIAEFIFESIINNWQPVDLDEFQA